MVERNAVTDVISNGSAANLKLWSKDMPAEGPCVTIVVAVLPLERGMLVHGAGTAVKVLTRL